MAITNYRSGSSDNLVDFYDKLCNFLTGANGAGWALHFNSSSTDKVFVSSGSDNKLNSIIRLSTQLSGVFKDPTNYHNIFSHVFAQGYNFFNNDTNENKFQYGPQGPMLISVSRGGTSGKLYEADCLKQFKENNSTLFYSSSRTTLVNRVDDIYSNTHRLYDGHRYLIGTTSDDISFTDILRGNRILFVNTGSVLSSINVIINHFNKSSGEQTVYAFNSNTTLALQTRKYNVLNGSVDGLITYPTWPAGANVTTNGGGIWDGGNSIFVVAGASTYFSELVLDTETFTTRSGISISHSTNQETNRMLYIPQISSGFGMTSGSSLLYFPSNLTVRTNVYDLTRQLWSSSIMSGNIPIYTNDFSSTTVVYDSNVGLYTGDGGNKTFKTYYYIDLSKTDIIRRQSFKRVIVSNTQDIQPNNLFYHHNFPKVRVNPTGSTNYWFLGNKDNVVVVTQPHTNFNGHFVMSFGRVDSFSTRPSMLVTEQNSNTGSVVLKVDNNVDYSIGETLTLFDKNSNNPVRRVGLMEKYGSSHIRINTAEAINVGTLIGDNSCNCAIYDGDDEFLTTNEQPISASCFDGSYFCMPLFQNMTGSTHFKKFGVTSLQKHNEIMPMSFYNKSHGVNGLIRNIFVIDSSDLSETNDYYDKTYKRYKFNGTTMIIDKKRYLVFKNFSKEMFFSINSNSSKQYDRNTIIYDYVIGPFGDA